MKRLLVATCLVAFSAAGCNITSDDLVNAIGDQAGKINVDKDTVMAISEMAMKQAAMATSALNPSTASTQAPTQAPARAGFRSLSAKRIAPSSLRRLSVTRDQCVQYSEVTCNETGDTCTLTEDYSACGEDFKGSIVRTFKGAYSAYRIDIKFDEYAEKPTTDANHFGVDGDSSITGSIGIDSANLTLHTDLKNTVQLSGKLVTVDSSSTFAINAVGSEVIIDGTQSGTIGETGQSEILTYTKVTFKDDCPSGPSSGSISVKVDTKESVTTITGCGKATITIDGKAEELTTDDIAQAFVSGDAAAGGDSLTDIGDATDAGSVLSGGWLYTNVASGTPGGFDEWVSIYDNGDGTFAIYIDDYTDGDGDGNTLSSLQDTWESFWGTFTVSGGNINPEWQHHEYYYTYYDDVNMYYTYDYQNGTVEDYTPAIAGDPIPYELVGTDTLNLYGTPYSRQW